MRLAENHAPGQAFAEEGGKGGRTVWPGCLLRPGLAWGSVQGRPCLKTRVIASSVNVIARRAQHDAAIGLHPRRAQANRLPRRLTAARNDGVMGMVARNDGLGN